MIKYLRLSRLQQWHKNGIVLAALLFAGEANDTSQLTLALIATFIFALLSSSIYIINDILDRESDRLHDTKRHRPIASGEVTITSASIAAFLIAAVALIGANQLGTRFLVIAVMFVALNILYSSVLKKIVIVDVMSIAFSFVLRAYAGAVAINVDASHWMIIMTLLLALFLGFGKRRHELQCSDSNGISHRPILGQYSSYLLDQCISVTTASVLVMYILYTLSPEVSTKLGTQELYFTIPFVIYGIFRYLYLIHKQEKGGSPSKVMIDDKPILLTIIFWLITVIFIMYWR